MSYSLSIYSTNDHLLAKEELQSHMANKGWELAFVTDLNDNTLLSIEGPVENGMIVYGWKAKDESATHFRDFLAEENIPELLALPVADFAVFSCEISYTSPYDVNLDMDEEELAEREEFDEAYVAALREATIAYEVTSGRWGSIKFTCDVWQTIGHLVGGLLDDAHEGKHEFLTQS
jgi:hypothetical protein